jgi:hypothetical protein
MRRDLLQPRLSLRQTKFFAFLLNEWAESILLVHMPYSVSQARLSFCKMHQSSKIHKLLFIRKRLAEPKGKSTLNFAKCPGGSVRPGRSSAQPHFFDMRRSDVRNDLLPEEPDLFLVHSQEGAEDKLRDTPAVDAPPKLRRALLWRAYHRDR